jgi:hypothetical protein
MPDSNSRSTGGAEQGPRRTAPSIDPETGSAPRGDEDQDAGVAAEHPKGRVAPLPPGHPSRGTIDEGGDHT